MQSFFLRKELIANHSRLQRAAIMLVVWEYTVNWRCPRHAGQHEQ